MKAKSIFYGWAVTSLLFILLMLAFAGGGIAMMAGYWSARWKAGDFDLWDLIGLRLFPEFFAFHKRSTAHLVMRVGIVAAVGSWLVFWVMLEA